MFAPEIVESWSEQDSPHLAKVRGRFMVEGKMTANRRVWTNFNTTAAEANARIARGEVVEMRSYHPIQNHERTETQNTLHVVGKVTTVNPDGTYEGMIANTSAGRDTLNQLRGGYLSGVSVRSAPGQESVFIKGEGGLPIQVVKRWRLNGIDFTNQPGAEEASVFLAETDATSGILVDWMDETVDDEFLFEAMNADLRKKRQADGDTMAGGKFPIGNQEELDAAVKLVGHGSASDESIKAHIRKQAKKYGLSLPESWTSGKESASADQTTEQEIDVTIADKIRDAVENAGAVEPAEKVGFDPNSMIGKAITEAESEEPEVEASEEPEVAAEDATADESVDDSALTEAIEAFASAAAGLVEAGASISSANKSKLVGAHDVLAGMAGMSCAPDADHDGESVTDDGLTEAQVSEAVERGVKSALTAQETQHQKQIAEMKALHESQLDDVLTKVRQSRRKSFAVYEAKDGAAKVAEMTRGERLRIMAEAKGHRLNS